MTDLSQRLTGKHLAYLTQLFERGITGFYSTSAYNDEVKDIKTLWQRIVNPRHDGVGIPYNEALILPNESGPQEIGNIIQLSRIVEGESQVLNYHAWADSGSDFNTIQADELPHNHFILSTLMSEGAYQVMVAPGVPYSFKDVYEECRAKFERFLSLPEPDTDLALLSLGVMATYYREQFESYPYFDFYSATENTGKTTAMMTFINSSYNGLALVSVTPAVLFRLIDRYQCTLGIDEINKRFMDEALSADLHSLMNAGYKRGLPCFRCDPETREPISYDGAGIKAYSRNGEIPRDLFSRGISFNMEENKTRELETRQPLPDQFRDLRDKMYVLRGKCYREVRQQYALFNLDAELKGRTKEIYGPLITIARLVDPSGNLEPMIIKRARQDEHMKDKLKITEYDSLLIATLIEIVDSGIVVTYDGVESEFKGPVLFKYIREKYTDKLHTAGLIKEKNTASNKRLATALRGLGFKESDYRPRNLCHYDIDTQRLERLKTLYCRDLSELPGEHTKNQVNHVEVPPIIDNIDNIDNMAPEKPIEKAAETQTTKGSMTPSAAPSVYVTDVTDVTDPQGIGSNTENHLVSTEKRVIEGAEYAFSRWSNGGNGRIILGECLICGKVGGYEVSDGVKLELLPCNYESHIGVGVKEVKRVGGNA